MTNEFSTGKSIVVLAIVVGCFAILWPKIFYPMFQAALSITTSKPDSENACKSDCFIQDSSPYICDIFVYIEEPKLFYLHLSKQELCKQNIMKICHYDIDVLLKDSLVDFENLTRELKSCQVSYQEKRQRHKLRSENYRTSRPSHIFSGDSKLSFDKAKPPKEKDKFQMREGRPFPHPSARQSTKPQPKSSGTMGLLMPVYTIIIIVFFLYTILKLAIKKPDEEEKPKPIVKDFHMDPEYRKFVLSEQYNNGEDIKSKAKKEAKEETTPIKEEEEEEEEVVEEPVETPEEDSDSEDYEIYQLRKKLKETEAAMERIMKHMGTVSECLATTMAATAQTKNERPQDLNVSTTVSTSVEDSKTTQVNSTKVAAGTDSQATSPNMESYELVDQSPMEEEHDLEESPSIEEIIEPDEQSSPLKASPKIF